MKRKVSSADGWGALLAMATGLLLLAEIGSASEPARGLMVSDPFCNPMEPRNPTLAPGNPSPGTRRMSERLREYYESAKPGATAYWSKRQVEWLQERLANTAEVSDRIRLLIQLGDEQTKAGQPHLALRTLRSVERLVADQGHSLDERTRVQLRMLEAVALLRLGEQENCLITYNAEACVFPLMPRAYHRFPRGSRGAIALFREHLREFPEDLSIRWLLNLATMTLGEYPAGVPAPFLIPPQTFDSDYDLPRFPDVSGALGIDIDDLAGGTIIDDFDNDGRYDLVVSAWDEKGQLRYFQRGKDGAFIERTSEAGLVGAVGALNIQQTDYNNDGWLDLWMLRGGWLGTAGRMPNSLLRNNGDGTFTDVTEEAGLLSHHPTQTSRWFDYDGDGWLDLFIGNESMVPDDPDWCELYHNNRDGTFRECAEESGIRVARFVKGVACADYDNDGRPDLFLSVRNGLNLLLRNDGPAGESSPGHAVWRFTDVTERSGLADDPVSGFGTLFFDYDNDGWEDLVVFGYHLPNGVGDVAADYLGLPNPGAKTRLYRNNRDGTFANVTRQARLDRICHTMGHNYGDLDNDGWLDLYCATGDPDLRLLIPNRMFRNAAGRHFQEVYVALGGAFAGDAARNALFLNPISTHRWLKLRLVGVHANRPAIGARLRVTIRTPEGTREIHRTVSSGGSFGSNPMRQEIGLGDATGIVGVTVRWPGSGTIQEVTGLELDRGYEIREGDPRIIPLRLQPLNWKPLTAPTLPQPDP